MSLSTALSLNRLPVVILPHRVAPGGRGGDEEGEEGDEEGPDGRPPRRDGLNTLEETQSRRRRRRRATAHPTESDDSRSRKRNASEGPVTREPRNGDVEAHCIEEREREREREV